MGEVGQPSVPSMKERFIGERLKPVASAADMSGMAAGLPGLPREFIWRDRHIRILDVRRTWKETGPCRHQSGERYVRKHWYEVLTASDGIMKIYFERQMRPGRRTPRWWIYTQSGDESAETGGERQEKRASSSVAWHERERGRQGMKLSGIRNIVLNLFGGLLLLAACSSQAASINVSAAGLAIHGYDTVAYFTEGRAVAGEAAFQYSWRNARWLFSKEEHLKLFQENPEKYAPQYGGF